MRSRALWASALVMGMAGVTAGALALQPPPGGGDGGGGAGQPMGPGGQPGRPGRAGGQGQPPSVEGGMKGMRRALEAMHDQIGDAAKVADNLRHVGDLQRACVAAKGSPLPAEILDKVPEADRAKVSADFRARLMTLLRKSIDLEEALMAGKADEAAKLLGEIEAMEDAGHRAMGIKQW